MALKVIGAFALLMFRISLIEGLIIFLFDMFCAPVALIMSRRSLTIPVAGSHIRALSFVGALPVPLMIGGSSVSVTSPSTVTLSTERFVIVRAPIDAEAAWSTFVIETLDLI